MDKPVKCYKKFCRNTPEKMPGIHTPEGWLCDKHWTEQCQEEERQQEAARSEANKNAQ